MPAASKKCLDLNIPNDLALRLAEWVEIGWKHPRVDEYVHGNSFLNPHRNNRFTADFFGFALVGKFGEPETALAELEKSGGNLAAIFNIEPKIMKEIISCIEEDQEFFRVGTLTVVEQIRLYHGQETAVA